LLLSHEPRECLREAQVAILYENELGAYVVCRDSKLTRLLQDSLGGKTKTCIVATISPTLSALEETINTLDYAMRARDVKNRPEINARVSQKAMIRDLTKENERLKAALAATQRKNGVFLTPEEYEEMEAQRVCFIHASRVAWG
jgi:kinesin family member 11